MPPVLLTRGPLDALFLFIHHTRMRLNDPWRTCQAGFPILAPINSSGYPVLTGIENPVPLKVMTGKSLKTWFLSVTKSNRLSSARRQVENRLLTDNLPASCMLWCILCTLVTSGPCDSSQPRRESDYARELNFCLLPVSKAQAKVPL